MTDHYLPGQKELELEAEKADAGEEEEDFLDVNYEEDVYADDTDQVRKNDHAPE